MRSLSVIITAIIMTVLVAACGDKDSFTLKGTVADGATMGLRFSYYDGEALRTGLAAAHEGRFAFKGVSAKPVMVEVTDNDYRVLARCYVANGDVLTLAINPSRPELATVDGNDVSRRWSRWLNDHADVIAAGDRKAVNELVALYVADHRDDPVAALLLLTLYDASYSPAEADRLLTSITPEARPDGLAQPFAMLLERVTAADATGRVPSMNFYDRKGRMGYFNPSNASYSLLVVDNSHSGRRDSILPALRRLSTLAGQRRLGIAEVSVDADTATWHRDLGNDSLAWTSGWSAGSIGSRALRNLGVTRLPYFVVTDSTGTRLYSGPSVTKAENLINKLLR